MTDNESKREATFEEEYEILQKEKEELFAMENCDSEPPFANCVVRRASRCIRKLLEEIQQYRAMEEKLNGISVERVVNGFINVTEKGTDEGYERGRILTNAEADMWNEYRAIGTVKEIKIREAQFERLSERYLNDLTLLREYQAIGTIEEFKAFRSGDFTEDLLNMGYTKGYNKAIDEFVEKLLENAPRNWAGELELGGATCYLSANKVKKIAEQLKGGV